MLPKGKGRLSRDGHDYCLSQGQEMSVVQRLSEAPIERVASLGGWISGASLVRLPIAKLLSLFVGTMTCADRHW